MAIVPALPDLSAGNRARDAEGILSDVEMLLSAITPDWTDRSPNDPGVTIMQAVAYLLDHAHWQIDRALTDAALTRSSRRSPVVFQAASLGYQVDGPAVATTTLRFTLVAAQAADVVISVGTQVQGSYEGETIVFETDSEVTIPQNQLTVTVNASHGAEATEAVGTSNGEQYQRYRLARTDIIHNRSRNSLVVSVGGTAWTEVQSFAESLSTSTHYVIRRDHLDRLTVYFGDGNVGKIPANGHAITALYRAGGGRSGNVPAGTITVINDALPAACTVTNTDQAAGGAPREPLETIKLAAPPYFAAQDRAVTTADFNALASAVTGILRAAAYRAALNMVEVRVVPEGWTGGTLAAGQQALVDAEMERTRMVTDVVMALAAIPVRPRINVTITARDGWRRSVVRANAQAALEDLYDPTNLDFGDDTSSTNLFFSDMVAAIDNSEGVNYVDVDTFTRVPRLIGVSTGGWDLAAGAATIGTVSVGSAAVEEMWTIEFTSATTFTVQGTVSGSQSNTGTTGVAYISDNGQVAFTITPAAGAPMAAGNRGRFITSRPVHNIPVGPKEHAVFVPASDLTIIVQGGVP